MRAGGNGAVKLALALAICVGVNPLAADEDPVLARAFEIHYRALEDAADVVGAVLSEAGECTLRPRLKTLVVTDRQSVLVRVGALLESWDVPPRNADFTFSLILGKRPGLTRGQEGRRPDSFPQQMRNVMEMLGDVTKWSDYEALGTHSVTSGEGERVVANLNAEYRVVFVLETIHEGQGKITLERLTLQRLRLAADGREHYDDLYRAGMTLTAGRVTMVGAAKDPDADSALFLAVQATPH